VNAAPKLFARIRDLLTSLLLVLAVSLAWPAMGAPHDQTPLSFGQHHPAAADAHGAAHEHGSHDRLRSARPDLGCCVMTHCHPGVAQSPLPMPHAASFPGHLPFDPADEAGVDPTILVPPPRLLLG
jgi:hypothetical protein